MSTTSAGAPRMVRHNKNKQFNNATRNDRGTNNNNNREQHNNHVISSSNINKIQHNHSHINGKVDSDAAHAKKPTAEQIRFSKLINIKDFEEDPTMKATVIQMCEVTGRTADEVVVALHDCDNNADRATNMLLEDSIDQGEWKESAKPRKKQGQITQTNTSGGRKSDHDNASHRNDKRAERSGGFDNDGGKPSFDRSTERQYSDRQRSSRGRQPPRLAARGNFNNYRGRDENDKSFSRSQDRSSGFGDRGGEGGGRGGRGRGRGGSRGGRGGARFGQSQRNGPEIDTWTNDTAEPKNDTMNVSSWGDDDENWEDAPTAPVSSTTLAETGASGSGSSTLTNATMPSAVDYAMAASTNSMVNNKNLNIQEDWSEDWSGTLDESKVFTSSVAPTVSKPSDSPVGTAPINAGVSNSTNYSSITTDNNAESPLYDIDTLQNTIEQSIASGALSGSQSFGQSGLSSLGMLPQSTTPVVSESPQYISQFSREATESIKNAVGIGSSQNSSQPPMAVDPSVISMAGPTQNQATQSAAANAAQRAKQQQRAKIPPRSKIPATAVEMPRNVAPVQLDLQFGAWDMPATTEAPVGGFSFGAPSIIAQTTSTANSTYTSPASQLAAQQQSESTLVNSDMDTTLSGKQQQSAMSELVDNLSASQNSTTDIYNPGKSPNKISSDSLGYSNSQTEHAPSHYSTQSTGPLPEQSQDSLSSSKPQQSAYTNSGSSYNSSSAGYGSSSYSSQKSTHPTTTTSNSYTHQSPSAGSQPSTNHSSGSQYGRQYGTHQSFHTNSTNQTNQNSYQQQSNSNTSGSYTSTSYNSTNPSVTSQSNSYTSQQLNSSSYHQQQHNSSGPQYGSYGSSNTHGSTNNSGSNNTYNSNTYQQDHQSAGSGTAGSVSNTGNSYGSKSSGQTNSQTQGYGGSTSHNGQTSSNYHDTNDTSVYNQHSQQTTSSSNTNNYESTSAFNQQHQGFGSTAHAKLTDNLSKLSVKDQHGYDNSSSVAANTLALTTTTNTTSAVSSIMATTQPTTSSNNSNTNLLSMSSTTSISTPATATATSKSLSFNNKTPNIPPGVPSIIGPNYVIGQPAALPIFSHQPVYYEDMMLQQRLPVVNPNFYEMPLQQQPTTLSNRDQNPLASTPYTDTAGQKGIVDHASAAIPGTYGPPSATAPTAAGPTNPSGPPPQGAPQGLPPPNLGAHNPGASAALDRAAINLSSFLSSKVGSVVYKGSAATHGTTHAATQPPRAEQQPKSRMDAQSPVQQQTIQQASQQAQPNALTSGTSPASQSQQQFMNQTAAAAAGIPPGYNYYIPSGIMPNAAYTFPTVIPMPTVPSVTNTQTHGSSAGSQYQKPGYNTHGYGGFGDLNDDYKNYGSATQSQAKNGGSGTSSVSDVSVSAYGKNHGQSYDKSGTFHAGTPPPFTMPLQNTGLQGSGLQGSGLQGSAGAGSNVGGHTPAHFNQQYMNMMMPNPHQQAAQHSLPMHVNHMQDSTGGSGRSQPGGGQPKQERKSYSTGYWG